MMFTATVPKKCLECVNLCAKPDYQYLNCIPKDQQDTHKKVAQEYQLVPFEHTIEAIF